MSEVFLLTLLETQHPRMISKIPWFINAIVFFVSFSLIEPIITCQEVYKSAHAKKSAKGKKSAQSKKSSKTKKNVSRPKSNLKVPTRLKKRRGSGATGVREVWRRDAHRQSASERWSQSKKGAANSVSDRMSRPSGFSSRNRFRPRYRRQREARIRLYQSRGSSSMNPHEAMPSETLTRMHHEEEAPIPPKNTKGIMLGLLSVGLDSWLDDLELETSMTMLSFNAPRLETQDDDWSTVSRRGRYHVDPSLFYRAKLNLYSRYIDLSVHYEGREGVKFLGDQGSLLGLIFAIPELIPDLAPLSFHLHRARFTQGSVSLFEEQVGQIEQQIFSMEVNRYEARWRQSSFEQVDLSVLFAYDLRALPRHIYLEERVKLNEQESYSIYYDISDQLLWTRSALYDFGGEAIIPIGDHLRLNLGAAIGFGSYELRTPVEGELLDEGMLLGFSLSTGLDCEYPLLSWLSIRASYQLRVLGLSPVGLPTKMEQEFKSEGLDLEDLALSFGTADLLHRAWFSLVFHLASKATSSPYSYTSLEK